MDSRGRILRFGVFFAVLYGAVEISGILAASILAFSAVIITLPVIPATAALVTAFLLLAVSLRWFGESME